MSIFLDRIKIIMPRDTNPLRIMSKFIKSVDFLVKLKKIMMEMVELIRNDCWF